MVRGNDDPAAGLATGGECCFQHGQVLELALHTALLVERILGGPGVQEDQDADGCGYGCQSEVHRPCLFPGGVGNTHGDPEAFRTLLAGVRAQLFDRLPDEAWVYPGHGNDTTIGAERPHLDEWSERGW